MLSTFHKGKLISGTKLNRRGEEIVKPDCVIDYNKNMSGVDYQDQLGSYYNPLRKLFKWYRKLVLHFLDVAMTNAYLFYKKVGGSKTQLWFRVQVIPCLVIDSDRPMSPSDVTVRH